MAVTTTITTTTIIHRDHDVHNHGHGGMKH